MPTLLTNHNRAGRRRALTLVEVVMGVAVFSLVIVSVFQALSLSFRLFESSRDMSRINQTLQYQMETLRGKQWEDFIDLAGQSLVPVDESGIPTSEEATIPFDWQSFELRQAVSLLTPDHYEVLLTASWTDRSGKAHTHTLKSWFSAKGLNDYYTMSTK
jgi:hypothetical protein